MTENPANLSSSKPKLPWLLLLVSVPALIVLLGLGTWQVQRLAWKEGLLAKIEARLSSDPVSVSSLADQLQSGAVTQAEIDYQPAVATGRFDHDAETFFFATHKGASGYYIYTPLELSDEAGQFIVVNRGFIPFDLKDPTSRPDTLINGQVRIEGLARQRLHEKPSWVVPDNDLQKGIFYWKDLSNMLPRDENGNTVSALPFFLDAGTPREPGRMGTWPVDGVTLINLPNNHLQYAVTWYGFAGTLLVVLFIFVRRRMTR